MIRAALGFAARSYQSCQAGISAVQENVAWIENRHTVWVSVCLCVREGVCSMIVCVYSKRMWKG